MNLFTMPVSEIKGIGGKREELLNKIGINSVYDLLYYFPLRYRDRSEMRDIAALYDGCECCIKCRAVTKVRTMRIKSGLTISVCRVCDDSGEINVVWYNNKFIDKQIVRGDEYVMFAKAVKGKNGLELRAPVTEKADRAGKTTGRIVPVYRLPEGIPQKVFGDAVREALLLADKLMVSMLPEVAQKDFMKIVPALSQMHFPENEELLYSARNRITFEEFFFFFAVLSEIRGSDGRENGNIFKDTDTAFFEKRIGFELTDAQKKVVCDIKKDVVSGKSMRRLIQGDVGSGKTIVSVFALACAVKNGYQGAIMAPTEILARQHYETVSKLLPEYKTVLLTSSVTGKNKISVLESIKSDADIIIGTHSLIEDNVIFKKLGLVVADEQHRFGVRQRQKLIEKGENPHLLVMTATPIPRTLSLVMYGDLDVSVIDSLPPGRKKIKTFLLDYSYRQRAYGFAQKTVEEGGQVYVVCPLVEQSETVNAKNAEELASELQLKLSGVKVGLLHGKMKDAEKNEVMDAFKSGETDILVSTTVVEVGVDVPNASLMIIENAERFGLSQLHQLRGRVGRGSAESYCVLFADTKNPDTIARLKVIEKSTDGFYISEQDLQQRGPGDFIGTRQHGIPALKTADLTSDTKLMYKAKEIFESIKKGELEITENEHKKIEFMINRTEKLENYGNILN